MDRPNVAVRGRAAEYIIRQIVERWRLQRPAEYKEWPAKCAEARLRLNDRGFSESGETRCPAMIPQYVNLMVGRVLGDHAWWYHDEDVLNALFDVIPCCRLVDGIGWHSSALCDGDKKR